MVNFSVYHNHNSILPHMLSAIFFPAEEFISICCVLLYKLCHSVIGVLFCEFFWRVVSVFPPHFCYSFILVGVNRMKSDIQLMCLCNMIFSYGILRFCALSSITLCILISWAFLIITLC